jgi:hypothetical protein
VLNIPRRKESRSGFSLIELTVASGLVVSFFAAVAVCYHAVAVNQKRLATFGAVNIGPDEALNFYGLASSTKDVYWAPNYGTASKADQMRDLFYADLQHASAVYCLPREDVNGTRPTTIALPAGTDARDLDTPNEFRDILGAAYAAADGLFKNYRGTALAADDCATIFILQPSESLTELWVWSIWEIDFVDVTSPDTGKFASVRRYVNGSLTRFYDVFFPTQANAQSFGPVMACFELKTRSALNEGTAIDMFKAAPEQPFYFVWWPDPASPTLTPGALAATYVASDPRSEYAAHEGQTSYFFVVPMFPAMQ